METRPDPVNPEITTDLDLEIPMIPEDPEEMAVREGIHERIQAEKYLENKEREAQAEEMLEMPPEWNEVPDLIMEDGDILPENMRPEKQRRDEISQGPKKRRKEDNIRAEKREHSPTVSRTQNPEGFYSEDWDEDKQEEDEWQTPDKFQKISQMVFCSKVLESHPVGDGVISSPRVQHQGGGCSI